MRCGLCKQHVHFKTGTCQQSISCSIDYHNDDNFGLLMDDRATIFGEPKQKYKKPSANTMRKNKDHIQPFKTRFQEVMADIV